MYFDQAEFDIRCEWGPEGVAQLASISDVVVIVDVLSFSTCIEIATQQGARVFPYAWKDDSAQVFATTIGAQLASKRGHPGYSLSPTSLQTIPSGTRLVLPSANGAPLSLAAQPTPYLSGLFSQWPIGGSRSHDLWNPNCGHPRRRALAQWKSASIL
ncbi:hypothetical protein ACN4EG_22900 [Alkalinema pantanalense CENA528]|uniref:hypothetical protein n=1 Tax=Alkalinema pantanalense TaxID=1620705 RepID=UPI003D701E0C